MDNELPRLTADEVKAKIEAGEKIEKYHIERLQINKKDFTVPINIAECEIEVLDLNKSTFQEDVVIRRSNVKTLVLSEATFNKKCDFKKGRIGRGRTQRAVFKDAAIFSECALAYCSFHESVFESKADFGWSEFTGDATFTKVVFKGQGTFDHVHFTNSGVFKETQWEDRANFSSVEVGHDLDLSNSVFKGDLWLAESVIRLSLNLSYAQVEGHTDFSNCSAGRSILLTNVKPGEKQGFRFRNATSPLIHLERDVVEGHIYPENEGKYASASKEYGFLRTTFQNINRFDDEDWAYYHFKRMERLGRPFSYRPLPLVRRLGEYLFLDLGCGYGTRPFRTLFICLAIVLAFAFCYFVNDIAVPSDVSYGVDSKLFTRFIYSIDVSLIAFSGGYGDLNHITGAIKFLPMLEYMLGVVLIGIFIVAFSRKVIR